MNRQKRRASFSPGKRRIAPPNTGASSTTDAAITSKMKVVVRVRPQADRETEPNRSLVRTVDMHTLVFDPKEEVLPFFFQGKKQGGRDMFRKQNRAMDFSFDRVFDGTSTNLEVFEDTTRDIFTSLLEGFNCSVFVYGATGAGKTFTMLGCPGTPGITYLTMVELFRQIAAETATRSFDVWVSYMEVYNENVRDLLKPKTAPALTLRDDGKSDVNVAGLEIKTIHNADELLALLEQGNKNRTQHPTDANLESSRSHAIFRVYIRMTNRTTGEVKVVKLSMIDLAGSERASVSGCKGMRFKEGANINKSLLALGNCINGLADGHKHIPYRDSKLTRILKDSLGGNCLTIMIANVSPSVKCYEDTFNTLKYAARAKKIKSKIKRNIVSVALPTAQYLSIIEKLEAQLKAYQDAEKKSANTKTAAVLQDDGSVEKRAEMVAKLKDIYEEKTRYHLKIMEHESKMQLLKYRIYLRIGNAQVLKELNLNEKELKNDLHRIYLSLEKYKVQIKTLEGELEAVWVQDKKNEEVLDALLKGAEASGTQHLIVDDIKTFEHELTRVQADTENLHLHRLLSIQFEHMNHQKKFTKNLSKSASFHYKILNGMDKVSVEMKEEYSRLYDAAMSKKVTWGQAHKKEYTSPSAGLSLPLQIPPKIEEFSTLSFATRNCQMPGDANNISQLNGSKKVVESSPSSLRLVNGYNSLEEFVRITVGEKQPVAAVPDRPDVQSRLLEEYNFEEHFSPVNVDLNTTWEIPRPKYVSPPPSRAALNETYEHEAAEEASMLNDAFVDDVAKQTPLNVDNLNETFVMHGMTEETSGLVKNKLKRPLPKLALVPCNKENKFKAPNAAPFRALRLPGLKVPKVPKIISPRLEVRRTFSQTPNSLRTPLKNVNSTVINVPRTSSFKKPNVATKDLPKTTPTVRPTNSRHTPFRKQVKN